MQSTEISSVSRALVPQSSGMVEEADSSNVFTEEELVLRKQFARYAARAASDESSYASRTLYCEMVLANSKSITANPRSAKAAAAIMALDALGQSSTSTLIADCLDALYPVVFAGYSKAGCSLVPSGVSALLGSEERLITNPVFSHSFAVDTHHRSEGEASRMGLLLDQTSKSASGKKATVVRIMARESGSSLRLHFMAWRGYKRRHRVEVMGRRLREQRDDMCERTRLLQCVFYSWKWVSERAMCTVLEERLHNLTFQLDNAKNQFQLQCFRSDRYLRTVEELRKDMRILRDNRDKYRSEVRSLELQLREQQLASRDHADSIAHRLLLGLNQWKSVAVAAVDRYKIPMDILSSIERPARPRRGSGGGAAGEGESDAVDHEDIEKMVIRWANGVLTQSAIASRNTISNFVSDFADGSVILVLMHHVYPNEVPYTPLQDNNVMRRLELIAELAATVGIAHFPSTTDFVEGAGGDIVFACTVELFLTHTLSRLLIPPQGNEADVPHILYDSTMVDGAMTDNDASLGRLFTSQIDNDVEVRRVHNVLSSISGYAAFLTRERMGGHPVQLSDPKEMAKYVRIHASRIGDLEFKYQSAHIPWEDQVSHLRGLVQRNFPLLKRIFGYYAGDNPCITEPNFWRFIGDVSIIDKTVTRGKIERIFVVANRDDDALVDSEADSESEDEDNPITELIPTEFVECIIRIGDQKMPGKTISERVEALLSNSLKSFGSKQAHMNKFRRDVYDKTSQLVVERYTRDLAKVFNHFAKQNEKFAEKGKKNASKYVTQQSIMTVMRDGGVLQGSVDDSVIHTVLRSVMGDEGGSDVAFHDFMECLAATSVFKMPNPFIPLDRKLEVTLTHLISNLRIKLRGSVTLSDVKPIPLSQAMSKRV